MFPDLPQEPPESSLVSRSLCLSELPAHGKGIGESLASVASLFDERDDRLKVILKKVLDKTSCDGGAQVRVSMRTPLAGESPDLRWMVLDILGDLDNGLPARVSPITRSGFSWEKPLRTFYGLLNRCPGSFPCNRHSRFLSGAGERDKA